MEKLERLVRPHLLDLKAYSSARDDFSGSAEVYLDANENPYPADFNRYPDPHQEKLKAGVAALRSCQREQVFIGNGSDEPIELLIRAFCAPGQDRVVIMPPTYGMYGVSARINDVAIHAIALTPALQLDMDRLSEELTPSDKVLFVCSPNNPTGNCIRQADILKVAREFEGLVVVDEAYIDFTDESSLISQIESLANLVVLQTFSKAWGLAGLRLGMAFAHPFIIDILNRIKPPYNVDEHAQAVGISALEEKDQIDEHVREIVRERKNLAEKLSELSIVEHLFPSEANFILARFKDHQKVNRYLLDHGVVVRDRSKERYCEQCLRVTVGTPAENKKLVQLLNELS